MKVKSRTHYEQFVKIQEALIALNFSHDDILNIIKYLKSLTNRMEPLYTGDLLDHFKLEEE